jgi:hypothetical protein
MDPMIARDAIPSLLLEAGGYAYSVQAHGKALDDAGFIEERDSHNGKNGYGKGRARRNRLKDGHETG